MDIKKVQKLMIATLVKQTKIKDEIGIIPFSLQIE